MTDQRRFLIFFQDVFFKFDFDLFEKFRSTEHVDGRQCEDLGRGECVRLSGGRV